MSAVSAPGPALGTWPSLLSWPCLLGPCCAVCGMYVRPRCNHRSMLYVSCSCTVCVSFCNLVLFVYFLSFCSLRLAHVVLKMSGSFFLLVHCMSISLTHRSYKHCPKDSVPASAACNRSVSQVPNPGSRHKHRPSVSSRKPINIILRLIFRIRHFIMLFPVFE